MSGGPVGGGGRGVGGVGGAGAPGAACPCGRGRPYDACCGPVHTRLGSAARAEDLMRARYSAYVLGLERFLLDSWHPSTRPPVVDLDPGIAWTGLTVSATVAGGPTDAAGEVSFVAAYRRGRTPEVLAERSRFVRLPQGWVYVDAVT